MAGFQFRLIPNWLPVLASLLLWSSAFAVGEEISQLAEGRAYSVDSGQLLYREQHRWSGQQHRIAYRSVAGELIAENNLDYRHEPWSPDFEQRELQSGYTSGARREADGLLLLAGDRQRSVAVSAAPVVSSGFDRFIRVHWAELVEGEPMVVDYALVSRLRLVKLRVAAVGCETLSLGQPVAAGQCFRVTAANVFLRMVAQPIELLYDEQRRLRMYRGQSNLRNSGIAAKSVEIIYQYPASLQPLQQQAGTVPHSEHIRGNRRYEL